MEICDTPHVLCAEPKKVQVYLITGFLGAGKTTLLKKVLPLFAKDKVQIIVNEFGKENVDGELLKETQLEIASIYQGSIFCACRMDQFLEVLSRSLEEEPDVMIIETSGLSNPSSIGTVLAQESFQHRFRLAGTFCLIDARNFKKVYSTAIAVQKQVQVSDVIFINKTDLVSIEEKNELEQQLRGTYKNAKIYSTTYGNVEKEWFETIENPLALQQVSPIPSPDLTLKSHLLEIKNTFTKEEFLKFLQEFSKETYRIKGFVELEGDIYLVDGIMEKVILTRYEGETNHLNTLIILSGKGFASIKSIRNACKNVQEKMIKFEP